VIRYPPPAQPRGFPGKAIVAARTALEDRTTPSEFPDLWGQYKAAFRSAQKQKCCWCEAEETTGTGAIDHYAPKASVATLVDQGKELNDRTNVRGRKVDRLHDVGYWWLAYDWENWVFSCERCNTAWKKTLFPVLESPHPRPDPAADYTPLLLHPFGDEDPLDHLAVDSVGQISARRRSARGAATITACGLDRESLRGARQKVVTSTRNWCKWVDLTDGDAQTAALRSLWDLGCDPQPFAAAVRSVIRRELEIEWAQLDAAFAPRAYKAKPVSTKSL